MTCPASLPGMSVFCGVDRRHPGMKEFTGDALEEVAPDLAW
jgi:hypothetical protein